MNNAELSRLSLTSYFSSLIRRLLAFELVGLLCLGTCIAQTETKKAVLNQQSWIAFELSPRSASGFPRDIYLMDQNGKHLKRLTTDHRSHSPSWSPDGRQIAFIHDEIDRSHGELSDLVIYRDFINAPRDLMRMGHDGANPSKIASIRPGAQDVFWFPDGKRLGIRVSNMGAAKVLIEASGRFLPNLEREERLSQFLNAARPGVPVPPEVDPVLMEWVPPVDNFMPAYYVSWGLTFSPIGPYAAPGALTAVADSDSSLQVISLDGVYSQFPILAYDLSWSRDGRSVAYSLFSGGQKSILYVAELQRAEDRLTGRDLTDEELDAHGPEWSSDGSRIAFTGLWRDSSQVFVINADGSNLVQLTRNPNMLCFHVSWSPDGRWIAAECRPNKTVMSPEEYERGMQSNIYLIDATGTHTKPRRLTRCGANSSSFFPICGVRNPSFMPVVDAVP